MNYQIINYIFSSALLSCPILFEIFALIGILASIWMLIKVVRFTFRMLWKIGGWIKEDWDRSIPVLLLTLLTIAMVVLIVFLSIQESSPKIGDSVILNCMDVIGTVTDISDSSDDEYTKYTIRYKHKYRENESKGYEEAEFTKDEFKVRKTGKK